MDVSRTQAFKIVAPPKTGWPRTSAWLKVWFGGSLGRRFVTMSLALLLVVQLASYLVINSNLQRHAELALPGRLDNGARAMQGLLELRAEMQVASTRLLSADDSFRAAVQSNDRALIAAALADDGARIGAAEVALLGTDLSVIAMPAEQTLDIESRAAMLSRLSRHAATAGSAVEVTMVDGVPRQMVLVPVKLPTLDGWLVACFALDGSVLSDVKKLSALPLTVLSRESTAQEWHVALTHLDTGVASRLAQWHWEEGAEPGTWPSMATVSVEGKQLGVRAVWLTPELGAAVPHPQVLALLSVSIDDAVRPPQSLQFAVMLTTLFGFVAFGLASGWAARRITTPLRSLAEAAEQLGSGGDHRAPVTIIGSHGEVEELALAFEQMRIDLVGTQERIAQSEKMASIGQLAAGVAHEINNPIGFVFSNFGTLQDYLVKLFAMLDAYRAHENTIVATEAGRRLARLREEIELDYLREDIPTLMNESKEGIQRVRKIVQDLKDFSHFDAHREWSWVDLHAGLDSTLNIVNNEIKYRADVVKRYGVLPEVECLSSELNQVFMNLLVNAAQAIDPNRRGTITVSTGASGDEVWVEVADTGCGMSPEVLKRIFDPFFTTKAVGKGTGLGLSLSYGIVKKHGGRTQVTSEVGVGTTFRVYLPVRRSAGT
jgi:signal transduction histidine kinase